MYADINKWIGNCEQCVVAKLLESTFDRTENIIVITKFTVAIPTKDEKKQQHPFWLKSGFKVGSFHAKSPKYLKICQ